MHVSPDRRAYVGAFDRPNGCNGERYIAHVCKNRNGTFFVAWQTQDNHQGTFEIPRETLAHYVVEEGDASRALEVMNVLR